MRSTESAGNVSEARRVGKIYISLQVGLGWIDLRGHVVELDFGESMGGHLRGAYTGIVVVWK